MSISLVMGYPGKVLRDDGIEDFVYVELPRNWNNFKNNIDRKYCIWSLFRYFPEEGQHGYKASRYIGSNQIVLRRDGEVIYDSYDETWLQRYPLLFQAWLRKMVKDFMARSSA